MHYYMYSTQNFRLYLTVIVTKLDLNLSIIRPMSQSDKCMSQYDAIVSHAHKACDSL